MAVWLFTNLINDVTPINPVLVSGAVLHGAVCNIFYSMKFYTLHFVVNNVLLHFVMLCGLWMHAGIETLNVAFLSTWENCCSC